MLKSISLCLLSGIIITSGSVLAARTPTCAPPQVAAAANGKLYAQATEPEPESQYYTVEERLQRLEAKEDIIEHQVLIMLTVLRSMIGTDYKGEPK